MNKRHWIYAGPYGRHNKIGIMHDTRLGNLLIYYNDKVMQVDFKVFEHKVYKFFVDEELCEIHVIVNRNGSFGYEFKFDRKANTEGNKRWKLREKKWAIQSVIAIASFFIILIAGTFIFIFFRTDFLERQLAKNGDFTEVTVRVLDRMGKGRYESFYHFKNHKGEKYSSKVRIVGSRPKTPHGLPIENGDTYKIKFATNNIYNHKIDYDQPTEKTALNLMKKIASFHHRHHQGRMQQELNCEVQTAFDLEGMMGLAKIYQQKNDPNRHPIYNSDAYLKLIRDTPFKKGTEDCWDQHTN